MLTHSNKFNRFLGYLSATAAFATLAVPAQAREPKIDLSNTSVTCTQTNDQNKEDDSFKKLGSFCRGYWSLWVLGNPTLKKHAQLLADDTLRVEVRPLRDAEVSGKKILGMYDSASRALTIDLSMISAVIARETKQAPEEDRKKIAAGSLLMAYPTGVHESAHKVFHDELKKKFGDVTIPACQENELFAFASEVSALRQVNYFNFAVPINGKIVKINKYPHPSSDFLLQAAAKGYDTFKEQVVSPLKLPTFDGMSQKNFLQSLDACMENVSVTKNDQNWKDRTVQLLQNAKKVFSDPKQYKEFQGFLKDKESETRESLLLSARTYSKNQGHLNLDENFKRD